MIVDALSNTEIVAPGEAVDITTNVYLGVLRQAGENGEPKSSAPSIKLRAIGSWEKSIAALGAEPEAPSSTPFFRGRERADASARFRLTIPIEEAPTQPYWLIKERTRDQYDWDKRMPRGLPFAPPPVWAEVEMMLDGARVVIKQPVEYRFADKTTGEIRREFKVAPPLTVTVRPHLLVIPQESEDRTREVSVEVTHNARHATEGALKLLAPQGWRIEADARPLAFTRQGERTSRRFMVTPPPSAQGTFELKAVAESGGQQYASGYAVVAYPHIETHFLYHPALSRSELFDVKVAPGLNVAYVMGSGDEVPEALAQLGVKVHLLTETELSSGDLRPYDVIILGIRAYEVREDVMANNKRLLDYVSSGGTLIVQYNKQEFTRGNFAPYPVKMDGGTRVTDEEAPVTVLVPDHALFNFPNKITEADWQGWVQERGLYFLNEWDPRYTPLLSAPDETGRQLQGGELIAQVGKGHYIFTAYAWFRQLPAGVPGAYRLFANMISLPKQRK